MTEWNYRNKSHLKELYIDRGLTQKEMSEKMGASDSTISQWMQRYGIETGNNKWSKIEKSEIQEIYDKTKTFSEMADRTGYNTHQIRNAAIKHGLHNPDSIDDCTYTDNELLEQIENVKSEHGYVSKRLFESIDDTATVSAVRDHFGSWLDGIKASSVEPTTAQITRGGSNDGNNEEREYENPRGSHTLYRRKRKEALKRDNYTCQVCNKTAKSSDVEILHTHHVKPVNAFDDPNDSHTVDNLITLCKTHHNLVENNKIECPDIQ